MTQTATHVQPLSEHLPRENIIKRRRIIISRLMMWPVFLVLLFTASKWEIHPRIAGGLFLVGCFLVALATIGRIWCSLYICGYKTKSLIVEGPYSLCRNPLYLFSAMGATGVALATETMIIPCLLILVFSVFYPFVIRGEEGKLLAIHGEPYRRYMDTVPRFWPRSLQAAEPLSYVIVPRKIRRALIDSLWFVWIIGLIEFAEALRDTGVLATWWTLY